MKMLMSSSRKDEKNIPKCRLLECLPSMVSNKESLLITSEKLNR